MLVKKVKRLGITKSEKTVVLEDGVHKTIEGYEISTLEDLRSLFRVVHKKLKDNYDIEVDETIIPDRLPAFAVLLDYTQDDFDSSYGVVEFFYEDGKEPEPHTIDTKYKV